MVYSKGKLCNHSCSWCDKNALASEGLNGDTIATPSICLYNILSNIKYDSLVAKDRFFNSLFFSNHEQCRCF